MELKIIKWQCIVQTYMRGNIQKLYKIAGKWDDQKQYKDILEAEMVTTPEGCTESSPMSPVPSVTVKNSLQVNKYVNLLKFYMSNR